MTERLRADTLATVDDIPVTYAADTGDRRHEVDRTTQIARRSIEEQWGERSPDATSLTKKATSGVDVNARWNKTVRSKRR